MARQVDPDKDRDILVGASVVSLHQRKVATFLLLARPGISKQYQDNCKTPGTETAEA